MWSGGYSKFADGEPPGVSVLFSSGSWYIQGSLYYPFEGIKNCKCVGIWRISLTTVHCLGWQWKRSNDPRYILTLSTSRCRVNIYYHYMQFGELVVWGGLGLPPYRGFSSFLGNTKVETTYWHSGHCSRVVACLISGGGDEIHASNLMLDIKPYSNLPVSTVFDDTTTGSNPKGMVKKTVNKAWNLFIPKSCRFENPHFYGSSNPKGPIFLGIELHATWLQLPAPFEVALWRSGLMVLGTCRTLVMNVIGQSLGLWKCQNENGAPTKRSKATKESSLLH